MLNKKEKKVYVIISLVVIVLTILITIVASSRKSKGGDLVNGAMQRGGSRSHKDVEDIERYSATAEFQTRLEDATSDMDGRIEFFGRVVDHRGQPVSGASVHYRIVTAMQIVRDSQDSFAEVLTDENGRFKIAQRMGTSLSIELIKKDGFRFLTRGNKFSYGFGISSRPHLPDSQKPVEFLMVPSEFKFTSIARQRSNVVRFKWNSGPVEVPLGKTGKFLVLHPTRDMKEGEEKGFAWSVEIEIKDGMLLRRNKGDNLPLAPLTGYIDRVVVGYNRSSLDWGRALSDARFLFKTNDGKYGEFSLNVYADSPDDRTGASIAFSFNPTGERYLD